MYQVGRIITTPLSHSLSDGAGQLPMRGSATTRRAPTAAGPARCRAVSTSQTRAPSTVRAHGPAMGTTRAPWTLTGTSSNRKSLSVIPVNLIFRVSNGKRVQLYIHDFETESRYDFLYITWEVCRRNDLFSYNYKYDGSFSDVSK